MTTYVPHFLGRTLDSSCFSQMQSGCGSEKVAPNQYPSNNKVEQQVLYFFTPF